VEDVLTSVRTASVEAGRVTSQIKLVCDWLILMGRNFWLGSPPSSGTKAATSKPLDFFDFSTLCRISRYTSYPQVDYFHIYRSTMLKSDSLGLNFRGSYSQMSTILSDRQRDEL